jgi:hypothetical protein
LEAVVEPRRPSLAARERRFGPIRQLYGRPVKVEERPPRGNARADEREQRPRAARPQKSLPVAKRRPVDEDLDVVIKPKGPAAIRVQTSGTEMPRRHTPYPQPEKRDYPPRRERGERPERRPVRDRFDGDRQFGRGSRAPKLPPKREGPAVRQVYPPPDVEREETPPGQTETKPAITRGRQPHGPLMRSKDAAPVQKGKVRQLYPPPEASGEPAQGETSPVESSENYDRVVFDEAGDEGESSMFVNDAEELEDRRRRARERAEARRRAQDPTPNAGDGEPNANAPFGVPPNENDEWPVF